MINSYRAKKLNKWICRIRNMYWSARKYVRSMYSRNFHLFNIVRYNMQGGSPSHVRGARDCELQGRAAAVTRGRDDDEE